jgi:CubicO group peptidase (beta-lactamase class C family)
MMRLLTSTLFGLLLLCSNSVKSQVAPAFFADSLQSLLNASIPTGFVNSGAVLGVVVPGQWSWYGATGNAISGMTVGQPMTSAVPLNQFRVGSITKNMIATSILKMEQDGLLSIEDPISMYLRSTLVTDTIASSGTVLIRHLLNHTSGIANAGANNTCNMVVLGNLLGTYSLEYAINCGASQGELYAPGSGWTYSNTNYSILAMIIQNITGQPCSNYITQNIITPLNLTNTLIPTTNQIVNPHMGCYWNLGTWTDLTIINPSVYTGWADVVSTTEDLMTYYDSLLNGVIINTAQLNKMKLIDAAANGYGLGLDFYTALSTPFFGHYGEVANTSGLFFVDVVNNTAPNGYYVAYNFNTQGADMQNKLDIPIIRLMKYNSADLSNEAPILDFQAYPNPVQSNCAITLEYAANTVDITLSDLTGRTQKTLTMEDQTTRSSLDLTGVSKGVYLITVSNGKSQKQKKIVIE